ncbi:hypothetical protein [Parabacteroides sp.]
MRGVYNMTTVLMATKTVVKGTKTVVVAEKPRNRFEIYGEYPDFFTTGDSPGVQVFHNIRSFSYLITKRHRFFIFCLRRFFNRYQFR